MGGGNGRRKWEEEMGGGNGRRKWEEEMGGGNGKRRCDDFEMILFKYERRMGLLFGMSWAQVRQVALGSVISMYS